MRAIRFFLSLLAITLCFTPLALAQVPDPTVSTTAPIPGAGHHYLGTGVESVSPADGLVTFNLPIQTPAGRQLSLPFGFRYSSSEQYYVTNNYGGSTSGYLHYMARPSTGWEVNGWSYDLPTLTANARIFSHWQTSVGSPPTLYTDHQCDVSQNYVFRGIGGAQYTLGLGAQWIDPGYANSTSCNTSPAGSSYSHGIFATAATNWDGGADQPGVTVYDQSGTTYSFPGGFNAGMGPGGDGPVWTYLPQFITDRNGNQISLKDNNNYLHNNLQNPANGYLDTLGRAAVSWTGIGNNGDQLTVSGLSANITLHWTNVPVTFPETFHNVAGTFTCGTGSTPSTTIKVVSEIDLPNGQKYTFAYDPTYGRVSKITFPGGGYVRYVWGLNTSSAAGYFVTQVPPQQGNASFYCDAVFDNPAVTDRYVSNDGASEVFHQHFVYYTGWNTSMPYVWLTKTTVVTATDLLTSQATITTYNYGSAIADSGGPYDYQVGNNVPRQVPVETSVYYADGSGIIRRTIQKSWLSAFAMGSEGTFLDNNQGASTLRCYDGNEQVTDVYEYGFQNEGAAPANPSCASNRPQAATGPLKRHTATIYHNFLGATPSTNIVNAPDSVTVYESSGNQVKRSTFTYDGSSVQSSGATTGFFNPPGLRGNATSISHWLNTGGSSPTTTYTYWDTGQVKSVTDACGNTACADMTGTTHTTAYSYTDNYASCGGSAPPAGSTNAYLTTVTNPLGQTQNFCYGYLDGLPRSSKDANNLITTYQYVDPLLRLTQTNSPDGGQIIISYNDTPPAPSVTTTKKMNSTQSITSVTVFDGLGHSKQSQLTSDPQGTVFTDTTYDGFGRAWKQSNPHRTAASATDGTTTNYFDALGRGCLVVPPGGTLPTTYTCATQTANSVLTAYFGNSTTVTDQTGRQRRSFTDSLGHLSEVDEPGNGQHDAGYYPPRHRMDLHSWLRTVLHLLRCLRSQRRNLPPNCIRWRFDYCFH